MKGIRCAIKNREKEMAVAASELSQFTLGPAQKIECSFIATDMTWSLLCLDGPTRQAVFVQLPAEVDLSDAPFSFIWQFEQSNEVILVSFDDLEELSNAAPCPDKVVMVYSIGRCGSTLVSNIFSQIPGVWSVSEPDPYANLIGLFAENDKRFSAADVPMLIRASTRLAYRPTKSAGHNTLVIKHRSQTSFFLNEMAEATEGAINLYLHRDVAGWANSFYQFIQKLGVPVSDEAEGVDTHTMWKILTAGTDENELLDFLGVTKFPTRFDEMIAGCWNNNIGQYFVANEMGMDFQAFSYHQLNNEREATVSRLLQACELGMEHLPAAMTAYEEDSQKGTTAARSNETIPLSDDRLKGIAQIVAKRSRPEILDL